MTARPLTLPRKCIILLLVLGLHSLIMLIVFKNNMNIVSDEQEKKLAKLFKDEPDYEEDQRWATTKAAASQLGAPVIFTEFDDTREEETAQNVHKHAAIEKPIEDTEPEEAPLPIDDKPEQEENKNIQVDMPVHELNEASLPAQPKVPENTEPKMVNHTQKLSTKPLSQKIVKKRKETTQLQKKAVSLADITRGYLEQLKNEGSHQVNVIGDSTKRPTDEQIKYERYWAKIQWCIQNSLKIHRGRYEPTQPVQASVRLFFKLNRSGTMHDLALAQSSGISDLDQFMLFAFQDAAHSFPPLPSFIKEDPYPIMFTVDVMPYSAGPIQLLRN